MDKNQTNYDSRPDTIEHIKTVGKYMANFLSRATTRIAYHDKSKLESPEVEYFDKYTPILKDLEYGTKEYIDNMEALRPAIDHHYANNPHHPEYWENGIKDMSLVDIVEMLCDWVASCQRHPSGNILRSIEINQKRFGYSDELKQILINTLKEIQDENMQ